MPIEDHGLNVGKKTGVTLQVKANPCIVGKAPARNSPKI